MAIALTQKIREDMGNGQLRCVYLIEGLADGANNVSAESLGLTYVDIAEFHPQTATTSAGATSILPIMGTNSGTHVTITATTANDNGTIIAYGH
jgi:hypothetical protein